MSDILTQNVEQISIVNHSFSRSKKTGRSCGFAFVEFKYREVAEVGFVSLLTFCLIYVAHTVILSFLCNINSSDQVVAESMNNYLMFDRLLKCSVVPKVGTKRSLCGEKRQYLISLWLRRELARRYSEGK